MLIAIANQSINNAEREDRGCECQDVQRVCFGEIENDDLSADGEQRNHDDRADLDDGIAAFGHHQQRFLEFECNDHRKDHSEHGLEG